MHSSLRYVFQYSFELPIIMHERIRCHAKENNKLDEINVCNIETYNLF